MKKAFKRNIEGSSLSLVLAALLLLFFSGARAQAQNSGGVGAAGDATQESAGEQNNINLAEQLKLTPEQVGRIAVIREQTKEERSAVNQRLREAQRALEDAIYADNASEALIEERTRELSAAQAEAVRLRARTELNVRRVLTPEQLSALREIRERARTRQQERRLLNPRRGQQQQQRPLGSALMRPNAAPGGAARQDRNIGPADANTRQGASPRVLKRRAEPQRRPRL